MDRIGAPAIGEMVERYFYDLDRRVVHIRDIVFVEDDTRERLADVHSRR